MSKSKSWDQLFQSVSGSTQPHSVCQVPVFPVYEEAVTTNLHLIFTFRIRSDLPPLLDGSS